MSLLFRPYTKGSYNLPKGRDLPWSIDINSYTHKRGFFSRKRARWRYHRGVRVRTRHSKRLSIIPYLYKNTFAGAYLIGYKVRFRKYVAYDKM